MKKTSYLLYVFLLAGIFTSAITSASTNTSGAEAFNLETALGNLLSSPQTAKINLNCLKDVMLLTKNTGAMLSFVDASGKIWPDGLLQGNLYSLGNYDACRIIQIEGEAADDGFSGKYCLSTIPIATSGGLFNAMHEEIVNKSHMVPDLIRRHNPDFNLRMAGPGGRTGLFWGLCVPQHCSASDLTEIFKSINKGASKMEPIFDDAYCSSKPDDPALSTGAIITIVILILFVALALLATAYDVSLTVNNEKNNFRALMAFSLYSNGRSLLKTSSNPNQLLCLQGIRALSMAWVIVGHIYSNVMVAPVANTMDMMKWMNETRNMWIVGATVSVDSFFMVGGLVTIYTFMMACDRGVPFNILLYYIHRYIRLTPVYAIIMLIHATLVPYFENSPLSSSLDTTYAQPCRDYWWRNLLYIQNFWTTTGMCVPQSWYLAVDFQIFIFSPLVLYPLYKWPKIGLSILGTFIFGGVLSPFLIGYLDKLPASMGSAGNEQSMLDFMKYYYIAAYARFGPYVIGMAFGYVIYLYKKKQLNIGDYHSVSVTWYWIVALAGLLACVYSTKEVLHTIDRVTNAFFLALDRNGWSVFLGMVILACVTGYGGPINDALSMPIFQFIAKLSYTMYLTHYLLIVSVYISQQSSFFFKETVLIVYFFGVFLFSLLISIPFSLIFESPMIILEKMIFSRDKKPEPVKEDIPAAAPVNSKIDNPA